MSMRKAKIVCTIGPASSSPAMLDRLIENGMDVARLNFSHGTHESHAAAIAAIRRAASRRSVGGGDYPGSARPQDSCGPVAEGRD